MSATEPTPQQHEAESMATIKQLTRDTVNPAPLELSHLSGVNGAAVAHADPPASNGADSTAQPVSRLAKAWSSLRPEVVRSCSTALRHMGDVDVSSIAVTSTFQGEGRTTVAAGLAATATAELGRNVILLDLDLEHGAIGEVASFGAGPGVTEYLFEEATLDDCLQPLSDTVSVIRAGRPRDRAEVVARIGRLPQLVLDASDRFDMVIADLPSLSEGVTTARIADLFQSVILVVRAGKVAIPQVEQAASVLSQPPFVILNGTEVRWSRLRRIVGLRS